MSFNLLTESWLPVRRKGGRAERVAPWRVVGGDDPPEALAAPRPDFQAALHEFLIGLLQTACPPADRAAWRAWLAAPPEPETLQQAFEPLAPYFELLGERPLFLQDLELQEKGGVVNPVSALLIPEPTGKTLADGTDLFLKRGRVEALCPACAAAALYTLQAYAPSGGQGHRTGLRGGGPMTTIVGGPDLWTTLWSNVQPVRGDAAPPGRAGLPGRVFPWAAPTRTSQDGKPFTPEEAHPLHCFWAMPRRIVLLPEESPAPEACDVCGETTAMPVRRYVTKNFGYNYGETWVHPLTPYRDQGEGKPLFSVKGKAQITGYRHWMGLVYGNSQNHALKTRPAACVAAFRRNAPGGGGSLMAAGYDMDNMKAVQWCEGRFPILRLPDEDDAEWLEFFRQEVDRLVEAADAMRQTLVKHLKIALLGEKSKAKADQGVLEEASAEVWNRTEAPFYEAASRLAVVLKDEDEALALRRDWLQRLRRVAEDLFHEYALSGGFEPGQAQAAYGAFNTMKRLNWGLLHKVLDLPKPKPGGTTP
ncbi:MAG: type I-E CRISPR-associated protein Cse1/CasA [Desulfovibrionaceae bacterium]